MIHDPENIVFLGDLERRGKTVRFGIKEKDRSRHIYVIGQTGTGKSTLLEMLAMQDIRNGSGLIFMDPHGQSVDSLLGYVTPDRMEDVIYFAPHLQQKPIGLNIMEDIGYDRRHLVVSSLLASFEKIWGAGTWSDRMAYILSNTLMALIEYPDTTLLDVGRMYTSKSFRERVVANLKDPQVRKYWVEEFANYTERYAQEATPSIQNKIGQFTSNPLIRNIIGQSKSAFDFRGIMDSGKVLLVNLSKGQIGENNARLLGVLFTTKVYLAALSRSDLTKPHLEEAKPCNFFVDEFQSFANSSFSDILSEARKYKLNLVLAHQYLGQLYTDDSGGGNAIRDAVFGNVGTFISFRVGPVDAEIIAKQFAPDIVEEDLVSLPRFHIFLTLNIDGAASPPFSARTFYESQPEEGSLSDEVVQRTMDTYGIDRAVVEKMVQDNLSADAEADANAKKGGGKKKPGQRGQQGDWGGGQKGGQQRKEEQQKTHTPLKDLVNQVARQHPSEKQSADKRPSAQRSDVVEAKNVVAKKEPKKREQPVADTETRSSTDEQGGGFMRKMFSRANKNQRADQPAEPVDVANAGELASENVSKHVPDTAGSAGRSGLGADSASENATEERQQQRSSKADEERQQWQPSKVDEDRQSQRLSKAKHPSKRQDATSRTRAESQGQVLRGGGGADARRDRSQGQNQKSQDKGGATARRDRSRPGSTHREKTQKQREGGGRDRSASFEERRTPSGQSKNAVPSSEHASASSPSRPPADRKKRDVRPAGNKVHPEMQNKKGRSRSEPQKQKQRQHASAGTDTNTSSRPSHRPVDRRRDVGKKGDNRSQGADDQGGDDRVSAGHGDMGTLIDQVRSTGLRKDLKIAPKKKKPAPPVQYEEGWVSIDDLGNTGSDR